MQTWEYMLVKFEYWRQNWRPKAVNDRALESWAGGSGISRMSDFLGEVGAEGWELVTSTPGPGLYGGQAEETLWYLIFKRPKQ